jgi:hypothetical protein
MDEQLNRMAGVSLAAKIFTPRQGQYLAFIHLYTRLHRRPPAEADMRQYFRVSKAPDLKAADLLLIPERCSRNIDCLAGLYRSLENGSCKTANPVWSWLRSL